MGRRKTWMVVAGVMLAALTARAQEADTLMVQRDSTDWDMNLKEVTVETSSIRTEGNRTVVGITKEMRRGAHNTAQMLGNIRGLTWNAVDNSVEYQGKRNIIVLVDSLEKGYDYVMKLHHLRFAKVEIIDQPHGKYEGHDALINLVTKKDYEGYEGSLYGNTRFMPAGPNAGKFLFFVTEGAFTYTKNKWNFVADVTRMSDNKTVLPTWYERTFPMLGQTERVLHDKDTSEKLLDNHDWEVHTSADYQLNKNHSFSWTYKYNFSHNQDKLDYLLEQIHETISTIDTLNVHSLNNTNNRNHSTALFYRGKSGKWNYDADFNYVYNHNTPDNTLQRGEGFTLINHYNDYMHYTRLRSSARRNWYENRLQLSMGYHNTWKNYKRDDFDSHRQLNTNGFFRNCGWFHLWGRLDSIGHNTASIGGRVESIHARSNGMSENLAVWSVNAMYWHKLTEKNWIRFNYDCNIDHPNQAQTTDYGYFTDSLTWSGGNPFLRANVNHQWKVWFDAWWCFNAQAGVTYAPNTITGLTELRHGLLPSGTEGDYAASTYVNSRYLSLWASLSFTKRFCKNFVYKADVRLARPKAWYDDFKQKGIEFHFKTSLQYYNPKYKTSTFVGYELQHNKFVTPQSYSTNYKDDFLYVTIGKPFWKERLYVNFLAVSPLKWGDGISKTYIVSPAIQSCNYFCSWKSNNRAALQLQVTYRFTGGKSVREYNREMSSER
ncbi:MAG: hypothetical protein K2J84_02680 [Bacteroidaceae bacterium]|nr:hypothetical protein [Bacteroidaceae bacterium]